MIPNLHDAYISLQKVLAILTKEVELRFEVQFPLK